MRNFFIAIIAVLFFGCGKELSFETPNPLHPPNQASAVFTLSGAPNGCTAAAANGAFIQNAALSAANTITIRVAVTVTGPYTIATNAVNGYTFSATGSFTTTGNHSVTLSGSGTPLAQGTDNFTLQAGQSSCTFSVTVVAPAPAAFTLTSSAGACSAATVNGAYALNAPLAAGNTVALPVNVTATGTYAITTNTVSGITFSATGAFTTTGNQTVTLTGSGTPTASGAAVFTPQVGPSSCTFTVNVLGDAQFALAGAAGTCSAAVINGTYTTGTPLTASNTVMVSVNVTTPGAYSLSTTTVNGISFSATGHFTTTGTQTVSLRGTGTPITAGVQVLTIQAAASSCTFSVTVGGPAVYTFGGAPGACSGSVVNGTYTVGTPLSAAHTLALQVNVTTTGSYNISTASIGGIKFSAAGTFAATGLQTVTLNGSGTPTAAGKNTFTVGTGGCTFDVDVAVPSGTFRCKINGVLTNFTDRAHAEVLDDFFSPPTPYLHLDGYTGAPNGSFVPQLQIFITRNDNAGVGPGTYTVDGFLLPSGGYRLEIDYHEENPDQSVTIWNTSSSIMSANPPFSVVVTSRTATRISGTFSGTLTNTLQGGTVKKTITEGVFDLPIY